MSATLLWHTALGASDAPRTLVALHGIASRGRVFRPLLAPLAGPATQVVLPDLLGHGASPWPSENAYTIADHLDALEEWAEVAVPDRPLTLVGVSMGALLAIAWGARRPERIAGIVAISTPLFRSRAEARAQVARGDWIARLMLDQPQLARAVCRRICGHHGPARRFTAHDVVGNLLVPLWLSTRRAGHVSLETDVLLSPEALHQAVRDGIDDIWQHSWESLNRSLHASVIGANIWGDLDRLAANATPLWFAHGGRDVLAPVERARAAASDRWPLAEYAGAGHALVLTHAPVLSRQIGEWFTIPFPEDVPPHHSAQI